MKRPDPTDEIADAVREARFIAALTGAGISTGSGIPDYRGPDGVWTRNPAAERLSSIDAYVGDADVRRAAWRARAANPAFRAEPNRGHFAIAALGRAGYLHHLVTQNVDGLHQRAGTDRDLLVEIHGTIHEVACLSCGRRQPMGPVLERVRGGDDDPACGACGGILKSATVSFGEALDPDFVAAAVDAARQADLYLAIGTSLTVHPVAGLPRLAAERGARLVIVNAQPTPLDDYAEWVVREDVGAVLAAVAGRLGVRVPGH